MSQVACIQELQALFGFIKHKQLVGPARQSTAKQTGVPAKNMGVCPRLSHLITDHLSDKAMVVKDFTVHSGIGILAFTETWLHDTGYQFLRNPRLHARGGGDGLLSKPV